MGHFQAAEAAMGTAFVPCLIVAFLADSLLVWKKGRNYFPLYWFWYGTYEAVWSTLKMVDGKPAWSNMLGMTLAIVLIHWWWKRRPPRNRKRKKLTERIKVRAGKLVVVPAS